MTKTAAKVVGYPIVVLSMIVIWGGHTLIVVAWIAAVVGAAIQEGIVAAILTFIFGSIGMAILHFIWSLITAPLAALIAGVAKVTED